ncbi:MAG: hypothetical protein AB7E49_01865 [Campylobacterales bacterium]
MLAADTQELFLGKVDRGELRGKRVSMSGYVNATGCEKLPCRLMAYRWIDGAKVLFILEFQDRFQPYASRKRVLDPIRVHCVAVSDFEYKDCFF